MSNLKQYRKTGELKNWDNNPRSITKEGLERLKKQIVKLGQYKPLLITEDGTVLGGNMRLRAYRELGVDEVWVSVVNANTEEDRIEYALSDNDRVGKYEADDLSDLIGNFPEVNWSDYAIDLQEPELVSDLIDRFQSVEEDEAPEVSDEPAVSKLGEIYQLGRHRLMCGDSIDAGSVTLLMNGQKADMVLTDPPYNTGMTEKSDSTRLSHMFKDSFTQEEFDTLITKSLQNMFDNTKGSAVFYVCIDWRNMGYLKDKLSSLMPVKNVIVWDKMVHGLGSDYKFTYEMVVVGKKGEPEINNRFGDDYRDIWHFQREIGRNEDHATAKPIGLLVKPINHASKQDDIVLDLFGGSGSTLIACEQTNRTCYMMELDPKYCDVIRKRYAKFIGKENEWQEMTIPL